jgi:hypothetical protein
MRPPRFDRPDLIFRRRIRSLLAHGDLDEALRLVHGRTAAWRAWQAEGVIKRGRKHASAHRRERIRPRPALARPPRRPRRSRGGPTAKLHRPTSRFAIRAQAALHAWERRTTNATAIYLRAIARPPTWN